MNFLFGNKIAIPKPGSLQWQFFRKCFGALFNPQLKSKFSSSTDNKKTQYKYEAEDKLRRFYLRPGRGINYVFQIIHKKNLKEIFFDEAEYYPDYYGYSVIVRDISREVLQNNNLSPKDIKDYIERVVVEAAETEFDAYYTLPEILSEKKFIKWYHPDGSAKKEIMHVLLRHKERGWVISNHMNPSTKRILNLKVKSIEKEEAIVATIEYWYLRWWDINKESYTFPYRETNRQSYILKKHKGSWKVHQFIRPQPRTSLPHRRNYSEV
jgi:hypothetical protein